MSVFFNQLPHIAVIGAIFYLFDFSDVFYYNYCLSGVHFYNFSLAATKDKLNS